MRLRLLLACAAGAALVASVPAAAKDFDPGDLRLCNANRCVPVRDREALALMSEMYYSAMPPARVRAPVLGAPAIELRFRNGYATGVAATRRLNRFLSFGVHLGHFRRGVWYRIPAVAADQLRRVARELQPLRVDRAMLARSR